MSNELDNKKLDDKVLLDNIGKIAYTLDKAYMPRLEKDYEVLKFDEDYNVDGKVSYASNIRAIQVDKWLFDKEQEPGECFKNVLSTFSDGDHTIALVVKRTPQNTEMYFVVKNEGEGRNGDSRSNVDLLDSVIKGNFPGTHTNAIRNEDEIKKIFINNDIIKVDGKKEPLVNSIALFANTPSQYSEKYVTQGLDKLLNGIVPKTDKESYTVVFLAESISQVATREIISGYENIASAVNPFLQYQFQMGNNEIETNGEMTSISKSQSITESISKTHSINAGVHAGYGIGGVHGGVNVGYGYNWGKSRSIGNSKNETEGKNYSIALGKSESTTYTYKSYMVSNLLERLERTMKRINKSSASGLWKYSTYVLAYEATVSKNVANYLKGITQGKESYDEPTVVQEWSKTYSGSCSFSEIKKYISLFCHPIFISSDRDKENRMMVTATSFVGTDELSNVIAFPKKSLQGIPIISGVSFGREAHSLLKDNKLDIDLGCGYHMHKKVSEQRIFISKEELTKHTFITGSTGSGKSNTIYRLLEKLTESKVNFLVVEPAKGEYKDVIGKREGVVTYGTNPNLVNIDLLRINPFRFPKSIHILEHLDRLVEIFNVCWPMYAAMPAILKDSVERAYISAGWDLEKSTNRYDENIFPTFSDVVKEVRIVLNESDYSDDNKGDYIGSLVTRLNSLTNGINGLIFTTNDISDVELFDRNVIVDLSRVGSTETKSLIMGLLILKLQEYRMEQRENGANADDKLKHVTVLEEAHNLLRRTSTEQTSEGSNLLGKSVEMLANSIAEMRTYGEGFIIADQSPGLLDMSVIRNTNTKIILRLPDFSDRELVGKASGLTDNQIIELAKLEKGVAAISQSDWIETVLCKIDKYYASGGVFENIHIEKRDAKKEVNTKKVEKSLLDCIMNKELYRIGDRVDIKKLKNDVLNSKMSASIKCKFLDYINSGNKSAVDELRSLVYEFFNSEEAIALAKREMDVEKWVHRVVDELDPSVFNYKGVQIDLLIGMLLNEKSLKDISYNDMLTRYTEVYIKKGSVY